ncbi:MAG TPA: ABC transporter permease [Clostridia bacterium]
MLAFLETILSGANQGLLYALLALGVYITFRILNFADLTTEGSFALGGAVAAALISNNIEPVSASLIAFLAGGVAGLCTGILNTKLKIQPILAGILTMIALYSINIRIMGGQPNTSLLRNTTVVTYLENLFHINRIYAILILGVITVGVIIAVLYWFFGTEIGSAIRATGNNENMCRALGINTDNTKILALMIGNGLISLSGALVAQQQSFSDVSMGIGAIVIGLAAIIIGETFTSAKFPFWAKMLFVALGSVIYRILISLIIFADLLEPYDIKLLTAVLVTIALALPKIFAYFKNKNNGKALKQKGQINKG